MYVLHDVVGLNKCALTPFAPTALLLDGWMVAGEAAAAVLHPVPPVPWEAGLARLRLLPEGGATVLATSS